MDYAGLDYRNIRFPVNRPLTAEERASSYNRKRPPKGVATDFLSVIRVDSTSMELVDRWYGVKGFNTWLGTAIALGGVAFILIAGYFSFIDVKMGGVAATLFSVMGAGFVASGVFLIRTECFRMTHYPILLDRRGRMVHVTRTNGSILSVRWDDLFFFAAEARAAFPGKTHDLRAHVLSSDGKTVLETFSLVYVFLAGKAAVDDAWAFVWRYMEEEDGPASTFDVLKESVLMPVDERKEGAMWSIFRTFVPGANWPIVSLMFCVPLALNSLGRIIAMSTCRLPVWPSSVKDSITQEPDDPYRRTAGGNPPLNFAERDWPIICFCLGLAIWITVLAMVPWVA